MAKRFSRLKYALKAIQNPNSSTESNRPPSGSPLYEYTEFASGSREVSYPRDTNSRVGSIEFVSVNPFGYPLATDSRFRTKISNRVLTAQPLAAARTASGIDKDDALLVEPLFGYTPAKAVIRLRNTAGDRTNVPSQITGVKYDKKGYRTYVLPYGAKTGSTREPEVRSAILTSISAEDNSIVTFYSEKL